MAENDGNYLRPSIPKYDGHYDHWSMLMENLLRSREYWSLIEDGVYTPPAEATPEEIRRGEESRLKDLKCKNYLFQAIDRSIIETILVNETAKDIWTSMKQKYEGSTKVKRTQLLAAKREFELLGHKEGEKINDYFARTMQIVNRMQMFGEKVDQLTIVEKILRSLTKKFNYVVCSIIESNDVTALFVDSLQSSLVVHETMMEGEKKEEQALKVSNGGRGRGNRGKGRSGGRIRRGRGRSSLNKESIDCYNCGKLGHYQYECPNLENKANYAEEDDEEDILRMAVTEESKVNEGDEEYILLMAITEEGKVNEGKWFLDSGCSNHMVGNRDWFFEFDEEIKVTVRLGNDKRMVTQGR